MRYRLRTLLILLAVGPPILSGLWWRIERRRSDLDSFRHPFSGAIEVYDLSATVCGGDHR